MTCLHVMNSMTFAPFDVSTWLPGCQVFFVQAFLMGKLQLLREEQRGLGVQLHRNYCI